MTQRTAVTEFEHEERISRQRAAERLVDIAFALTAGHELELRTDGVRAAAPIADEVLLTRRSVSTDDRVVVEVKLRWSA